MDTSDQIANSIPEVVRRTGLSRSTVYRLMDTGQLAYVKIGSRRLIPEDALHNLIDAHRVAA